MICPMALSRTVMSDTQIKQKTKTTNDRKLQEEKRYYILSVLMAIYNYNTFFPLHHICSHGHHQIMLTGDNSTLFHKNGTAHNTFWLKMKVITYICICKLYTMYANTLTYICVCVTLSHKTSCTYQP